MVIKNAIRKWAQRIAGYDRYLFVFAWVSVMRAGFTREGKELRYFSSMIKDDGVILDIGANIGISAVLLAKEHKGSDVYAFEPVPSNAKTLQRVCQFFALKHIHIFPIALGNNNGSVEMITPFFEGARMQGLSHVIRENKDEKGERITVRLTLLDDIKELHSVEHIAAIKIDTENYEYEVLQGALKLIGKHRPLIFCELWNDDKRPKCFDLLKQLGYRAMILHKGELVDAGDRDALNFFFLPDSYI